MRTPRVHNHDSAVLPLPATRDLHTTPRRRRSIKRWLMRVLRRPIWS